MFQIVEVQKIDLSRLSQARQSFIDTNHAYRVFCEWAKQEAQLEHDLVIKHIQKLESNKDHIKIS